MSSSRDQDSNIFDVFHMIERNINKRILVVIDRDLGLEGKLSAVSRVPPGIWLSDAESVIFRSTLANPIPQIVARHRKSEIFINLTSIQRIEVLPSEKEHD